MNLKTYHIPYSHSLLPLELPEHRVVFEADLPALEPMHDWKERLVQKLDAPTAGAPLCSLLSPKQHIVLLVEDNTRHTPVKEILPILCDYLCAHGCALSQIEILIAPGVNRTAVEADLLIGLGNIIPHPNAGYSGGAKILDPGCCGKETVSATHISAALMGYLPLGQMENQCRDGLEQVARRVGLDFIINVVLDAENRVVDLVTGDFVQAHRAGAQSAKKAFGVPLPCQADILISCSYPYDIDYWQCEKALISGYFAVKKGGIIILAAPCLEGLAHNHDDLLSWLGMSSEDAKVRLRYLWSSKEPGDLVSASIAIGAVTVREHAQIFIYSQGLTDGEISTMGYRGFSSLQAAVDAALDEKPDGVIGILKRGGDCLPLLASSEER